MEHDVKTIYLARHGEAEHNTVPPPEICKIEHARLTEKGEKQARFIAARVAKLPIDLIVTSRMLRAQQTAHIVMQAAIRPYTQTSLFAEAQCPSAIEGKPWLDPETQRIYQEWEATMFSDKRVLDGENFSDLVSRADGAQRYLEARTEENILVVTHGLFKRVLAARVVLGDSFTPEIFRKIESGWHTINTGLTILKHDPKNQDCPWWMLTWNDHAHLAE